MPETSAGLLRVRPAICDETARVCANRFGKALHAIVLTGSLARDEGTALGEGTGKTLLGDADFYLVFHDRAEEPGRPALDAASREIETALLEIGLISKIALSAVKPGYLAAMPRHILTYELRSHGMTVWGDRQVLSLVPAFSAEQISREDAWRLLANRLVEQLGTGAAISKCEAQENQYSTVKLYLDMATSFLVFAGGYQSTYRGRERSLRDLANTAVDLPVQALAAHVTVCTAFKLDGKVLSGQEWDTLQKDRFKLAWQVWRWELAQLTGEAGDCSDSDLMSRWMACQPLKAKLRGWGSVMRRSGRRHSSREWWRWLRLARKGSPRYWIYSVAADLLFCSRADAAWTEQMQHWSRRLPISSISVDRSAAESRDSLARLVMLNYREFVETTTA